MILRSLMVLVSLASVNAFAGTQPFDAEVTFNTPGFHDQEDTTVEQKLVELINRAAPGSAILMAQYNFSRPATARALNAASERGVDVRIVLDGNNLESKDVAGNATSIVLNGENGSEGLKCSDDSCIKFCKGPIHFKLKKKSFGGSCNGFVINHNKFFLFSKLTDGAENVVVQSSENITDGQMHMYNDLIVIKNDRGLYNGFMDYWGSLYRNHFRLSHYKDAVGDGPVEAKFFPRYLGRDPVVQMLDRVSCKIPGSVIRVSAADFTRLDVAARLRDRAKEGCDVKVISRFEPRMMSPGKGVGKRLGRNMIILPYLGKSLEYQAKNSIHTKLMIINASVDGSAEKRAFVLTGSHNLDFFSLHTNDETMLVIEDQKTFDQYLDFWNRINADAHAAGFLLTYGDGSH